MTVRTFRKRNNVSRFYRAARRERERFIFESKRFFPPAIILYSFAFLSRCCIYRCLQVSFSVRSHTCFRFSATLSSFLLQEYRFNTESCPFGVSGQSFVVQRPSLRDSNISAWIPIRSIGEWICSSTITLVNTFCATCGVTFRSSHLEFSL